MKTTETQADFLRALGSATCFVHRLRTLANGLEGAAKRVRAEGNEYGAIAFEISAEEIRETFAELFKLVDDTAREHLYQQVRKSEKPTK
jgi:hypothetical protein